MSLDRSHLEYPARTYGMDHDRYQWSMLKDRPAISWPGGAKLALWINVSLQHFPLNQSNQPFAPPGGMTMPYPDLRHYSLRDYGNRIGVFRVMSALERSHMSASFAVNAELCEKAPHLIQKLTSRGFEILGHGWNMDSLHYGGLAFEDEQTLINKSLHTLRRATGQPIRGWLSPARNESEKYAGPARGERDRLLLRLGERRSPLSFQNPCRHADLAASEHRAGRSLRYHE